MAANLRKIMLVAVALLAYAGVARAGTRADLSGDAVVDFQTTMDMPFVEVGNPGNPNDTTYGGKLAGSVDYTYLIGKFEVTAGQYSEFLNAVAATDTHGLYNTNMWSSSSGCKIARSGSSGSYTYSVAADWADRPVNYVNHWDALRFANWLTNGMPTGAQNAGTTEDGSYDFSVVPDPIVRQPDARYVVPSLNEWYKAAYYDGVAGVYYDYPTGSNTVPANESIDPDPGNNANWYDYPVEGDHTIGAPYWRTEVGEFENSSSPYGTYDQAGNILEQIDQRKSEEYGLNYYAGGSYQQDSSDFEAWNFPNYFATAESFDLGFRVGYVPEPATLGLLALGGLAMVRRRRK